MRMVAQTGGRPMGRRPTHEPLRYTPHHDEYIPPLAVLQNWNASIALPICVAKIDGKGLGVVNCFGRRPLEVTPQTSAPHRAQEPRPQGPTPHGTGQSQQRATPSPDANGR